MSAGQLSVDTLPASHPRTLAASVQKKYLLLYIYIFLCFTAVKLPNSSEKLTNPVCKDRSQVVAAVFVLPHWH